jgi:hypothetical protein
MQKWGDFYTTDSVELPKGAHRGLSYFREFLHQTVNMQKCQNILVTSECATVYTFGLK